MLAGYSGGSVVSRFQNMIPLTLKTKEKRQISAQNKNILRSYDVPDHIPVIDSDTAREGKDRQNQPENFPLICRKIAKIDILRPISGLSNNSSKNLLLHYFSSIVHFIGISLQPNQNASRRMTGIEVLEHLFYLLSSELPEKLIRSENIPQQLNHYCCGRKIMSYAIRENIWKSNFNGNFGDQNFYTCEDDKVYKNLCRVGSVGVEVALSALSDGSDAVCAAAISALYISVPFIMQDESKVRIFLP